MDSQKWKAPEAPSELRLTNSESRLYIDICKDLFDTFGALKKILDTWEQKKEPQKEFIKHACRIPVLINEMETTTKNKKFATQVVRQVYFTVFCADRPIQAAITPGYQAM